mmetsp:Transcript_13308/g.29092  ORF Transcript_13308/g.29092 Transcript_13308/m.29092 type:complete len:556 (-) Transcript_13308:81-1748(-)
MASRKAEECATPAPGTAAPLKHRIPGCIFPLDAEVIFDQLFRSVGEGSFEAATRRTRNAELLGEEGEWDPACPSSGSVGALWSLGDDEAGLTTTRASLPKRNFTLRRQSVLPSWVRNSGGSSPNGFPCTETWTLFGQGWGRGFIIDSTLKVRDVPVVGAFAFQTRYRVTTLTPEGSTAQVETQIDLEYQLSQKEGPSFVMRNAVEVPLLMEVRRNFEAIFLPAAIKTLQDLRPGEASEDPPATSSAMGTTPSLFKLSGKDLPSAQNSDAPQGEAAIEGEYSTNWSEVPDSSERQKVAQDFLGGIRPSLSSCFTTVGPTKKELRLELMGVSALSEPSYRVGDFTSKLLFGSKSLLKAVYIESQLGTRTIRTVAASVVDGARSVSFDRERQLFTYQRELSMTFACRDQRGVQAVLRGDPVVGEGQLDFELEAFDGMPRWSDVELFRDGQLSGVLHLRYQFLSLNDDDACDIPPTCSQTSSQPPLPSPSSTSAPTAGAAPAAPAKEAPTAAAPTTATAPTAEQRPPPTDSVPATAVKGPDEAHAGEDAEFYTPPTTPR